MKKDTNNLQYGIYIDHTTAFVITVNEFNAVKTEEIRNTFVSPSRFSGETTVKSGMLGTTLDHQRSKQNKANTDFKKFCNSVTTSLKKVNQLLLFGPADAKYALHHAIENKKSLARHYCVVKTTAPLNKSAATRFVKEYYTS
jgi:hypothetical protein